MTAKGLVIASLAMALVGCSSEAGDQLSIATAETAGFQRTEQQLYLMVPGAVDGWAGEWVGDVVELYQYENEGAVDAEVFRAAVQPGNISGWVEMCQAGNMLMLSKGPRACEALKALE